MKALEKVSEMDASDPEFAGWYFRVFKGKTHFVGMAKDGPWQAMDLGAAISEKGTVIFDFGENQLDALIATKKALREYLSNED